jgi:hypothetical protein
MIPRSMKLDPMRSDIARGVGGAAAREIKTQYRSAERLAGMKDLSRVYWLTHETNHDAMALNDRVSDCTGFVPHRKTLG